MVYIFNLPLQVYVRPCHLVLKQRSSPVTRQSAGFSCLQGLLAREQFSFHVQNWAIRHEHVDCEHHSIKRAASRHQQLQGSHLLSAQRIHRDDSINGHTPEGTSEAKAVEDKELR